MYKVLHIFSSYGGGISSLIVNLVENKNSQFLFDLLAFNYNNGESFVKRIEKAGGHCFVMPRYRKEGFFKFFKSIKQIMKDGKYDAIHCHIVGIDALPYYFAAKKVGIKKFILHAHTTLYDKKIYRIGFLNSLCKFINYKIADAYMTCSDLAASYIYGAKYLNKRPAILIANGINEELYSSILSEDSYTLYRKEFGLRAEDKIVMHVGRFSKQKNHDFIIKIMQELVKLDNSYKLIFVGDGELMETIKTEIRAKNIEDYIIFAGRRLDVPLLMQFADIIILPSFYEGLPTVGIECQASGTPMLLSDTITRQADMQLGLVEYLPINDPEEWAEKIIQYATKRHIDVELCLEKIKQNGFTAKKAGQLYCEKLKTIIS